MTDNIIVTYELGKISNGNLIASLLQEWTSDAATVKWVLDQISHCQPSHIRLCNGTEEENNCLLTVLTEAKTFIPLKNRKNSYLARSTPDDVARVEYRTFICSKNVIDAGPLNNWYEPENMHAMLKSKFQGCMQGRTMYVIPFSMAPTASSHSKQGIQITDSAYVVVNMRMMTHEMGNGALREIERRGTFTPCLHSVGSPLLRPDQQDVPWPCVASANDKYIVHFTTELNPWIASFGSGYGGNALLGKKCLSLRIASVLARKEGWLAEHMLILCISPSAESKLEKTYICAAFPSACGKTNLSMLTPTVEALPAGYKIECLGDDIAWLKFQTDESGRKRLYAINPEAGFFGVAPGTSMQTNANAMKAIEENCIFTNVAMLPDESDVWWEGMTPTEPPVLIDWQGKIVRAEDQIARGTHAKKKAAHPNSRFTAPCQQCPAMSKDWRNPEGVPISAIIFGGRRQDTFPLVFQSFNWKHGVYIGATMLSEQTAAAEGRVGELRADPMAMRPFIGYNVGDYFSHWLSRENEIGAEMPKIFHVNWFRRDPVTQQFLWPGFGENARVLNWILQRCGSKNEELNAVSSPIGWVPEKINLKGLCMSSGDWQQLNNVDRTEWMKEIQRHADFLTECGERVPKELCEQHEQLKKRFA
mgnify:CR=1 FL=1